MTKNQIQAIINSLCSVSARLEDGKVINADRLLNEIIQKLVEHKG